MIAKITGKITTQTECCKHSIGLSKSHKKKTSVFDYAFDDQCFGARRDITRDLHTFLEEAVEAVQDIVIHRDFGLPTRFYRLFSVADLGAVARRVHLVEDKIPLARILEDESIRRSIVFRPADMVEVMHAVGSENHSSVSIPLKQLTVARSRRDRVQQQ